MQVGRSPCRHGATSPWRSAPTQPPRTCSNRRETGRLARPSRFRWPAPIAAGFRGDNGRCCCRSRFAAALSPDRWLPMSRRSPEQLCGRRTVTVWFRPPDPMSHIGITPPGLHRRPRPPTRLPPRPLPRPQHRRLPRFRTRHHSPSPRPVLLLPLPGLLRVT